MEKTSSDKARSPHNMEEAERKLDRLYKRRHRSEEIPAEAKAQRAWAHALDLGQGLTARAKRPRSEFSLPPPMPSAKPVHRMVFLAMAGGVVLLVLVVLGLFYYPAWNTSRGVSSLGKPPAVPEPLLSPRAQTQQLDVVADTLKSADLAAADLSKAEADVQRVLQSNPQNARAHKLLGDLYTRQSRVEVSLASYERALKAQPNYLEAVLQLALTYDHLSNAPAAISYYERACLIKPTEVSIRLRLASLYAAEHRGEAAREQYNAALALKLDKRTRAQINDEITRLNRLMRDEKLSADPASAPTPAPTPVETAALTAQNTLPPVNNPMPAAPPTASARRSDRSLDLAFPRPVLRDIVPPDHGSPAADPSVRANEAPNPGTGSTVASSPAKPPGTPAGDLVAPPQLTTAITPLPKPLQEGDELSTDLVDRQPVLRTRVDPRLPTAARHFSGIASVFMAVKVSETGRVIETRIIRKPEMDLGFSEAADAAVRQWRYEPAVKNGVRVKVWTTCQIQFKAAK